MVGFAGGVPERSKGADCKSAGSAFEGSNPSPSTTAQTEGQGRPRGGSSMVEPQPSKLMMRVRFPLAAPSAEQDVWVELTVSITGFAHVAQW